MKKFIAILSIIAVILFSFNVGNFNKAEAATVGQVLKEPEEGWKRYDDSEKLAFNYSGYVTTSDDRLYKNAGSGSTNPNNKLTFSFKGTKLRIIGDLRDAHRSNKISITIDGNTETFSQVGASGWIHQVLNYEKTGLSDKIHDVEIKASGLSSGVAFVFDAIDIDKGGYLVNAETIAESITLDKSQLELIEGSKDKLTATVLPEDATNKEVIWTSSDESIATVDQEGNVTAVKEGEAIITATVKGTNLSATSIVIVKSQVEEEENSAILSITFVNGITKEYDLTNKELKQYLNWFKESTETATFEFSKKISPYKKVTEYIIHDKIASYEVREY